MTAILGHFIGSPHPPISDQLPPPSVGPLRGHLLPLTRFSVPQGGGEDMDFDVDKVTGSLFIASHLDVRRRPNYNLTVEVTNGVHSIATQV